MEAVDKLATPVPGNQDSLFQRISLCANTHGETSALEVSHVETNGHKNFVIPGLTGIRAKEVCRAGNTPGVQRQCVIQTAGAGCRPHG